MCGERRGLERELVEWGWSRRRVRAGAEGDERRSTSSSTKPITTDAGSCVAAASARRFARTTPPSQYAWRYARSRYFQALRQNVLVSTTTRGAAASAGKPPLAWTSAPRTSPRRSGRSR
ncbi:MAG: hypothetical protein AUH85_13025 [Chloroflexi bacterium 13_1_40CM_4_68_4]|nr:MAG: hypothetical protein AUH85_13025 [Chloroflexi bacterium 13_1_40CM_4_68_4]